MSYRPRKYRTATTPYHRPVTSAPISRFAPITEPQHEGADHFLKAEVRPSALFIMSPEMQAAARRGRQGQNPWRQNYSAAY